MTNQKVPIQYTKDGKTDIAEFPLQDVEFKVSKTEKETYINAYNHKKKSLCTFIGDRRDLEENIKGLQMILDDKKLKI